MTIEQSTPPIRWPENIPVCFSKLRLKPTLVGLLEPASVVKDFDGIKRSAWPNATQVTHYLVDCRRAIRSETDAMCEIAYRVIEAAKHDEDICSRWNFLTACGLDVALGVYGDPGMDCLTLHIVRNLDAEARLRAGLAKSRS